MADISAKCMQCGGAVRVSEYVDIEILKCRVCGGRMEKPAGSSADGGANIRLAVSKPADQAPEAVSAGDPDALERNRRVRSFFPKRLTRPAKAVRRGPRPHSSALPYWMLFILILAAGLAIRWGGIVKDPLLLEQIIRWVLIAFAVLHVSILVDAFQNDILQGVLCLLVPFYSVYYLLTQAETLLLRAIGAAMLPAFGYDLALFVNKTAVATYDFINHWIMTVS